jgi:acyl-CoA reductase-like NAD-dependent aldehyde dehydrogenase
MFTGSTRTGRKVAQQAAGRLIPFSLELGGKDPMIVLADADLDRAVELVVFTALHVGGQTCTSAERVYVEEPVYDEFVAKITERFAAIRQGVSTGFGTTDIGAITFPPQIELIDAHVRDAVARGARVLTGGAPLPGPGRFYPPTILVDVDHSMLCMRDETFGPPLPIMKVRDADEAIGLANDSGYGLQASIFSRDIAKADRLASRVEAGAVCINDTNSNFMALEVPMGGWKDSGVGSRHGVDGIRKYTRRKTVVINAEPVEREIHTMPFIEANYDAMAELVRQTFGRNA